MTSYDDQLIWDKTQSLRRLMNNESLLMRVVAMFIEETPARLQQLSVAIETGDFTGIREQAHTLKGSASEVGALALADGFVRIENYARHHNMADITQQFRELDGHWRQFLDCVQAGA